MMEKENSNQIFKVMKKINYFDFKVEEDKKLKFYFYELYFAIEVFLI